MNLFNIFFNKKSKFESPLELEKIYLTYSKNDNVYGFQKKFYNQSEKLLNIFGKTKEKVFNTIKLIIITDTHNTLNEEKLIDVINEHPDYDLCVLLGDHNSEDIEKVLRNIPKNKIYALLGNHDYNYIEKFNLNNFNGKIIEFEGIKMMGIQGSFKYKPSDFPSFTQEESILFLKDKPAVDILFSHDGPFDDNMINNPAHQGLFGITYYLYKNNVSYNIHGHLHNPYNKKLLNGTNEISLYGINYIELGNK